MTETVCIGIGSNLGTPVENCLEAQTRLERLPRLTDLAASPLYHTRPFGKTDQPPFVNSVVQAQTDLTPRALLQGLLAIEREMGRVRGEKWGPRRIDLDLLYHGNRVLAEPGLRLPHPGIQERVFVLAPLCDLSPDWVHPVLDRTAAQLLAALGETGTVRRVRQGL
ncbi:MAG: 2-amino-4-hydroxy-6-hydroxymethyldihydropteridine diphosphokinase [Nitrospinaceae bacterium]